MNKENCALKLVDEIILYYDARSKKHKKKCKNFTLYRITPTSNNVINKNHLYDSWFVVGQTALSSVQQRFLYSATLSGPTSTSRMIDLLSILHC